jgi:hypothetical protein
MAASYLTYRHYENSKDGHECQTYDESGVIVFLMVFHFKAPHRKNVYTIGHPSFLGFDDHAPDEHELVMRKFMSYQRTPVNGNGNSWRSVKTHYTYLNMT